MLPVVAYQAWRVGIQEERDHFRGAESESGWTPSLWVALMFKSDTYEK